MIIRAATNADTDAIWKIFSEVIKSGDTYVFDPDTPKSDFKKYWFADYMNTFVAEDNHQVVGTYIIKPNQIGLGNHVANCSYMVSPDIQGRGIGKALCKHSIQYAKTKRFKAIQFNIVVSTNTIAVELWKKFGFKIIGITPKAFRHQSLGLVDAYIMHRVID